VRCCENSGDRTRSTRGGADAGDAGAQRASSPDRGPYERLGLRYVPRPDQDADLRDRIVALAHRHRRYGAGMIYLKLRQEGRVVNHKRVDRLYAEARLQVRRRRREKVPLQDRQPLLRPQYRNEVWSADFVFDRTVEGRVLKCLTIVDDATTEAVAIVPARALGGRP
jgi:putative transposase